MPKKGSFLRELPVIVVSALIVSIVIKTFFLHFFFIPSGSMENTLQVGDRIAVNKFGALFSEIKRGEVAVFADPDNWLGESLESDGSTISGKIKNGLILVGVLPDPAKQYLIKRVIGVGGDNVICCDATGKLQVNGVSVTEPYVFEGDKPSDMQFNVDIPKGFVWVMGDHRCNFPVELHQHGHVTPPLISRLSCRHRLHLYYRPARQRDSQFWRCRP